MLLSEREHIARQLFEESIGLLNTKGLAYAGAQDSLANFKRNAERLGLSPFQIWAVYFNKHIDSINNAIKINPCVPVDKTEGLRGRIVDSITYLTLLQCLLDDNSLTNDIGVNLNDTN
jgi:hypothetical protein